MKLLLVVTMPVLLAAGFLAFAGSVLLLISSCLEVCL